MGATPIFVAAYNCEFTDLENADSTNEITVFTPGANGSRVESIVVTSDDSSARNIQFGVAVSGTTYFLFRSALPIGSTTRYSGDALADCSAAGRMDGGLILESGQVLKAWMEVAVTAGKKVTIGVFGGNL